MKTISSSFNRRFENLLASPSTRTAQTGSDFGREVWCLTSDCGTQRTMPPFDAMDASLQQAKEPKANVVVAGGGPAGLVCAIMLGRRGVPTVVIEPRERLPGWKAAHSNVIHLNTRGQSALQCAAARA